MLIAHLSDPHILYLRHAPAGVRNGKQLFGLVNWLLRRLRVHRRERLKLAVSHLLQTRPEALVITGDLCQLAIPADYHALGRILEPLRLKKIPVFLLRGNHDFYSRSSSAHRAFEDLRHHLALGMCGSDGFAVCGNLEFVPFDGAVPTPAFRCWGRIGEEQLRALETRLAAEKHVGRMRIACGHFPLVLADGKPLPEPIAMRNAGLIPPLLQRHGMLAYLCGHIHKPFTASLPGGIPQFCSGSLTAKGVLRLLEISSAGVREISTQTFEQC